MYTNRAELSTHLMKILQEAEIGIADEKIKLNEVLTGGQMYYLIMHLLANLPKTSHEKVIEFANTFEVEKETTFDVQEFTQKDLRLRLLLEEVIELGASLGFSKGEIYHTYVELQEKVFEKKIEPSIKETFDALLDIAYVLYGAVEAFNLSFVFDKGMTEVHDSNISKVLPLPVEELDIKNNISKLSSDGTKVISKIINNKYVVFKNQDTDKVLKPLNYQKPDLQSILDEYLKL